MRYPALIVVASVLMGIGAAVSAQAEDTYLYPPAGDVNSSVSVEAYKPVAADLRPIPIRRVWISPANGEGPQPVAPPPPDPYTTDPVPPTVPPLQPMPVVPMEGEMPLVTPAALDCGQPCVSSCDLDPCRRWTIQLEGNVTWVNDPEGAFGLESFTGQQMNWDGLKYDPAFGGGGMIQYAFSPGVRLQLRGSYLGKFDAEGTTAGQFAFAPPIVGIAAANAAALSSEAELWTGELNLITQVLDTGCARYDLGIGARAISFEETAIATDFGTAFDPGFPGAPFVRSEAKEFLLGAQVVTAAHFDLSKCFEFTAAFKPGLGYLSRELVVRDRSIFAGGPHVSRNDEEQLVFMFEAELSFKWRLSRCFSFVGGYRLLFVDEIVRANDAMDYTKSFSGAVQARHETDQLFAHTLFAGISIDF